MFLNLLSVSKHSKIWIKPSAENRRHDNDSFRNIIIFKNKWVSAAEPKIWSRAFSSIFIHLLIKPLNQRTDVQASQTPDGVTDTPSSQANSPAWAQPIRAQHRTGTLSVREAETQRHKQTGCVSPEQTLRLFTNMLFCPDIQKFGRRVVCLLLVTSWRFCSCIIVFIVRLNLLLQNRVSLT